MVNCLYPLCSVRDYRLASGTTGLSLGLQPPATSRTKSFPPHTWKGAQNPGEPGPAQATERWAPSPPPDRSRISSGMKSLLPALLEAQCTVQRAVYRAIHFLSLILNMIHLETRTQPFHVPSACAGREKGARKWLGTDDQRSFYILKVPVSEH